MVDLHDAAEALRQIQELEKQRLTNTKEDDINKTATVKQTEDELDSGATPDSSTIYTLLHKTDSII